MFNLYRYKKGGCVECGWRLGVYVEGLLYAERDGSATGGFCSGEVGGVEGGDERGGGDVGCKSKRRRKRLCIISFFFSERDV